MQINRQCAAVAALAAISLVSSQAMARNASQMSDLVGARAASAQGQVEARGFTYIDEHVGKEYVHTYWWNARDKNCIDIKLADGRYHSITDAANSDCNQKGRGGAGAAVAGAAVGALLIAALTSHKSSHHDDGKHYANVEDDAHYERGYTDGLHNAAYHNYDRSDAYANGYSAGVDEREANLSHHQRRGGYAQNCPSDLRGNECDYYKDGYKAGAQDGSSGMSMAYERHDGYDSRFEPYFARGYTDGWRATR